MEQHIPGPYLTQELRFTITQALHFTGVLSLLWKCCRTSANCLAEQVLPRGMQSIEKFNPSDKGNTVVVLDQDTYNSEEQANYNRVLLGELSTLQYEVSGTLYAIDEETLFIKDFNYNGKGPDAFFYIGTEDEEPSEHGQIIRYPQDGSTGEPKILGAFNKQDITLHLTKGFKISSDLKWFSVWCRQYSADFGNVIVPKGLQIPEKVTPEPEPESSSEMVSHSSNLLYFTLTLALSTVLYFFS
ncbi:unnamed protein product, partial [Meganyctiphanes norvegica]